MTDLLSSVSHRKDQGMREGRVSQRLNIRFLFRRLWKIQERFLGHSQNPEETRRVYLLYFISVIAIGTLIALGIPSLFNYNDLPLGVSDLFLACILIGNILHAKRYKRYIFNIYLGICLTAMLFVYMFFTGGINRSGGFVWYYTFPLVVAFLLGSKKGAIATGLMLLPVIGFFLVRSPPAFLVSYSLDFKVRFISSFLMVFIFSYLFEYSRERNREELRRSYNELERRVEERTSALKEYQKVIEGSQDTISLIDQNYNYLLANNAFLKYRKVDRSHVIGRSVSEVLGKDIFEKIIKKNLDACFQGNPIQYESKYTYPELGERDILVSYFPIEGPQGVNRVASVIRDITERKQAEERLRESEERFRQLAENIREVFYIYEQEVRRISYISPAYGEIWGRTPQSVQEEPQSFWDAVHPEDRDRVMKSHEQQGRGEVEEVYRILRPDGSIRWIKDRSFPIHNNSGKTQRVVGIAADITDLKFGEEKLKYLSLHDPLTGLYNRIFFEEEIRRIEKGRYDTVGIVSCDVDGLKLVNDTLGHDHGDNLLVAAARAIQKTFREGDLVARIGGDEFAVVLPNTTEAAVENACERIQEAVGSHNATHPEFPLSISVGFAFKNGFHKTLKEVFEEADNHMYRKKLYRTQSVRSTLVKTLINTLKARDLTTEKHVIRLEKLLAGMAPLIGFPESAASDLSLLAKFHDIGKVGISDSILFKKGSLTPEEWTEMKRHPEIGYRIALSASDLVPIADWILKHHEWWNGGGYPLGIKGEEIPIECRLLAIADAYEAMTSVRPYRRAFSHPEALEELLSHSGTQFDPKLLKKFLQMLKTYPLELE